MRLFVAIYPPPEALDDVVAARDRLRVGAAAEAGTNVRLAPRSNLHVTVAFLGDVDDERLSTVQDALTRAVELWRRPSAPSGPSAPRLQLGGGGRFGEGRFTVLWVGLLGELDALRRLASGARGELRRAGLPYDARPLRPHLTLARPGERLDRASLDEDLRTLDDYRGPSWPATEVVLVRSHLGPRPSYDRLSTWRL